MTELKGPEMGTAAEMRTVGCFVGQCGPSPGSPWAAQASLLVQGWPQEQTNCRKQGGNNYLCSL